ncbi:SAM-dependent methyltransferase [Nonomuraea sp. NPDC049400]|uniref:SAM-dependent methyltransferase n=1 Tax=Nonomuraea sp. NPDC049400 TaxID=3364352 RepID=UPI0037B8A230
MRPAIDTTKPSPARMYDYFLGGKDNYQVDRDAAQIVLKDAPEAKDVAVVNRRFLKRATWYATKNRGVRQFLDLGSGLPTQENVHEVAQADAPNACVVYVDNDPSVLLHSKGLIVNNDRTGYVQADIRTPAEIITSPVTQRLIDFNNPVAVMLVSVLHFIPDADDPYGIVKDLMDQVPSGSLLILSHVTTDNISPVVAERIQQQQLAVPLNLRSGMDIQRFFHGLDLVDPGCVFLEQWAPGEILPVDETAPLKLRCGVAVKP